jgi:hypothetical protein
MGLGICEVGVPGTKPPTYAKKRQCTNDIFGKGEIMKTIAKNQQLLWQLLGEERMNRQSREVVKLLCMLL